MGHSSGLPRNDCKKVLSVLCHQEKVRLKKLKFLESTNLKHHSRKKRWLATGKQSNSYLRELKMTRFISESSVRDDDVSFHNVKDYIERNSWISSESPQRHHLVKDYLELSDLYYSERAKFYRVLSSALNNLKANVLNHVARITTGNKVIFERTRVVMKKIVEENIPRMQCQSASQNSCHPEVIKQLSLILRDPINFRKHLTLITPVTSSLLSSITKILHELDNIPIVCIIAMDRKIRGVKIIPEFFTNWNCDKERLIKRLRKQCNRILLKLLEGDELPKQLAKALSVMSLYKKQVARRDDITTTEFFPFSPETEALQIDILNAIWQLPQVRHGKLKILQYLQDPGGKLSRKTFRFMLNNYLMDYLFESCEEDIPVTESFLRLVAFINRNPSPQLALSKKKNTEEELETVLNVSSQFKQIIWDYFQDREIDKYMKNYDVKFDNDDVDDNESDDIVIDKKKKSSLHYEHGKAEDYEGADLEMVGESGDFTANFESPYQVLEPININRTYQHIVKFDLETDLNGSQSSSYNGNYSRGHSYDTIQTICDETSVLSHKLISTLMQKFQANRFSVQEEKCGFLVQAVKELVPFASKRYLASLEAFMDSSQN